MEQGKAKQVLLFKVKKETQTSPELQLRIDKARDLITNVIGTAFYKQSIRPYIHQNNKTK